MQEENYLKNGKDTISDEEFVSRYDKRIKHSGKLKRKEEDDKNYDFIKKLFIFGINFAIWYFVFSKYFFSAN